MFDPSRFLRLARAQWSEQRRAWFWFIGVVLILHFVLLLIAFSLAEEVGKAYMLSHGGQEALYFMGLFLTAPIFGARYFQGMARPASAGVLLMRPASLFEKWLLAAGVVVVAYPLVYSIVFNLFNAPSALYAQAAHQAMLAREALDGETQRIGTLVEFRLFLPWHGFKDGADLLSLILILATLQGFAVLGSLYFRSLPAIKTVLAAFLLLLLTLLVAGLTDSSPAPLFDYWSEAAPAGWPGLLLPLAWFGIPGLLWLACLFALQEREVA